MKVSQTIVLGCLGVLLALGVGVGVRYAVENRTARPSPSVVSSTPGVFEDISPAPSGPSECGADMDCLIAAAQNCALASATQDNAFTITNEAFALIETPSYYYEIRGPVNGKCVFYQRQTKLDLKFTAEARNAGLTSGATAEQLDKIEAEAEKRAEGKDLSCRFAIPDLLAKIRRWKLGKFDFGETECNSTPTSGFNCTTVNGAQQCTAIGGETKCTTTGGDYPSEECTGTLLGN